MLALDLYLREGPNAPRTSTEDLSRVLRAFPIEAELTADPSFRSEASIRRKLGNFTSIDPQGIGGLTNASALDLAVWDEFHDDPQRLAGLAAQIRAAIATGETTETEDLEPDFMEAPEGAVLTRLHRVRERNRGLVETKKQHAVAMNGALTCEACGFDYRATYGNLGDGFIECHHLVPVSELEPGSTTSLDDLALICANCHRMIHRRRPWLSLNDLRALFVT